MNSDELSWDFPAPCTKLIVVEPEHIDGFGHTNNCEYLKWCENMAWFHSEQLGLGLPEYEELGYGMAAVKTELEYCAASYQEEELCIGTWIDSCDGKFNLLRKYQIIRKQDNVTVLRGQTRFVCISLASGKAKRMPEAFVSAYVNAAISK